MFEKLSQAMRGNQNARKNKSPFRVGAVNAALTAAAGTAIGAGKAIADNKSALVSLKVAANMGKVGANAGKAARIQQSMRKVLLSAAKTGAVEGVKHAGGLAVGVGVASAGITAGKSYIARKSTPMGKIRRLLG